MKIIFRKATLKDLNEIQKLNLMLFKKEYKEYDKSLNLKWTFSKAGTKYFSDRITKKSGCAIIALSDNKIVGYLVGGITSIQAYRNPSITAELENMLVLEEYRSKQIGTLLYKKFLQWCKTKDIKLLRVEASAQNILGINFYKKNGFKEYSVILESNI